MKLPLLLSSPHAGWLVPAEAKPYCILTQEQIDADGDVGAREIYALSEEVKAHVTTTTARAIVDLNRAPDDRSKDGAVKTHTCWDEIVYEPFPPEEVIETLLEKHYHPYHRRLTELARRRDLLLAVDCHTMAAEGPPVGPDPGEARPWVCLSNGDGTCPHNWMDKLRDAFVEAFGASVSVNKPFRGGYITRHHATEMAWVQLELSRAPFLPAAEKRRRVLTAFETWVAAVRH